MKAVRERKSKGASLEKILIDETFMPEIKNGRGYQRRSMKSLFEDS
jgi:hypothetical protein